eukprot:3737322-Karenia_brevis.AAC.1
MSPADTAYIINKYPECCCIRTLVPPGMSLSYLCVTCLLAHCMEQHFCEGCALSASSNDAIGRCCDPRVEL